MRFPARRNCAFITLLILALFAVKLHGQTLTVLHTFGALNGSGTNSDGANPTGGLLLSSNALYGMATQGGLGGFGTLYSLGTTGTNFTVLHAFIPSGYISFLDYVFTNVDGLYPAGVLASSGNMLYGYCRGGGLYGNGTIFSVMTNGSNFNVLHTFSQLVTNNLSATPSVNNDGASPSGLIIVSNVLYGTAATGGTNGAGTVFVLATNTAFAVLHAFTTTYETNGPDGGEPVGGLCFSNNMFYGVAENGGANGAGTVYAVSNNGAFFIEHTFAPLDNYTSYEGGVPLASVLLSGNALYGSASQCGTNSDGTLFSIVGGTNYLVLHTFGATGAGLTNADGAEPLDGFLLSSNTLYGTADYGGLGGAGTVFSLDTSGSNFTTLYSFAPVVASTNADGRYINGYLVLSGNNLYGTANQGGTNGNGTIFMLTLPSASPAPNISGVSLAGKNLLIHAVNGISGGVYTVLTSTNFAQPQNQWIPVATNVLSGNGNFTITLTNAVSPSVKGRFYILKM
jgi:uncharacterized repeat protein (TIGR03803 family)